LNVLNAKKMCFLSDTGGKLPESGETYRRLDNGAKEGRESWQVQKTVNQGWVNRFNLFLCVSGIALTT